LFNVKPNAKLDNALASVCDWIQPSLSRRQVADELAVTWGYVADTRYDSFCYAMVEAMLAGCWCFCGSHLIYDERPCFRFDTPDEAVILIERALEHFQAGDINEEGRQFVIDNYSLSVFRNQFKEIVGSGYGV